MQLPTSHHKSRKEYWIEHIEAAEAFDGTLSEYCRLNGLRFGSMSSYRTKLGYSKPYDKRKKKSEFIPVKVSTPTQKPVQPDLPDPQWLAKFLRAWGQQ